MADFNQVLTPGDYQNGIVNTVVEIPQGSSLKIEWDREKALFVLDRVEPAIYAKPVNYGFIPQTLDEDGDEQAVRSRHRQQVHQDRLDRDHDRAEREQHQQEGEREHEGEDQRQPVDELIAEVLRLRRRPVKAMRSCASRGSG